MGRLGHVRQRARENAHVVTAPVGIETAIDV